MRALRSCPIACLAVLTFGCEPADEPPPDGDADADADADSDDCVDFDGDGAGTGDGCQADDCDDTDPGTVDECGSGCDANPSRRGCACPAGQVAACYRGPAGTGDNGACSAGLQRCEDGVWGTCEGQVLPGIESCDGQDNDCNGELDNGVLSACGDCNVDCQSSCIGLGCGTAFDPADGRSVVEDAGGGLTLGGQTSITNHVIWIANSGEGTVSKVDTRLREEVARYDTGPSANSDPSRSTVNHKGDVVSVNRGEGSATKILASDCVDQDGDGLRTSSGPDDVLPWGEDDCVVWHLDGIPGARGSAVELRTDLENGVHEYVWIGSYDQGTMYEIDSEEGELTGREVDGVMPYGAALGPGGLLWTFGGSWSSIVSIDTTTLDTNEIALPPDEGWYGITVDSQGRIWIGGTVARYDPATEEWESPMANVSGGGIAVDGNDNAWVGEFGSAWFVDGETMEATSIAGAGGHGWAIDFDGYAWSIIWGWGPGSGEAIVVDPETLEVDDSVDGFGAPYTYSDMTGFQLVNATNPVGTYPHIYEACAEGETTHWSHLTCEVVAPSGTLVSFRMRIADTPEALAAARWVEVVSVPPESCPVELDPILAAAGLGADEIDGRYAEVEATLESTTRTDRPILESMGVFQSCEGVFQ
ncbi:MAG: hypothetical protein HYY06_30410 [Deltaproteobacteria bacterium]|nr:hypothetical protein [Deltaproteobacteria bacterium]